MKIWGGTLSVAKGYGRAPHNEARVIVKAQTKKRALELLGDSEITAYRVSASRFNSHWCETGNPTELAVASTQDEGVWYSATRNTTPDAANYKLARKKTEGTRS
jgi:hypothetical protein